ncbi:hypothetical protein H696_02713 [Fonticula alba]|uniref:Glutamate-rich WD repeat-containing protein 1 n=1 Tax=Fonticula alba TaxID=691883 RepID=A0A058Z7V5_FONAL|nr:hypothetical protein H696_02713 [Fonticula alba]KCV70379.1 hypothetical protein H696_02713 [Fonticula alba]|eukprot:XP_009494895.1 hypothetical protein H696_02713 [Fonticula alba]
MSAAASMFAPPPAPLVGGAPPGGGALPGPGDPAAATAPYTDDSPDLSASERNIVTAIAALALPDTLGHHHTLDPGQPVAGQLDDLPLVSRLVTLANAVRGLCRDAPVLVAQAGCGEEELEVLHNRASTLLEVLRELVNDPPHAQPPHPATMPPKRSMDTDGFESSRIRRVKTDMISSDEEDGIGDYEDDFGDDFEEEIIVRRESAFTDDDDDDDDGDDEMIGNDRPDGTIDITKRLGMSTITLKDDEDDDDEDHESNKIKTEYPATAYVVTGTQADRPSKNMIQLMKMSQLPRTKYDDGALTDSEDEEDDSYDTDPVLEYRSIKHMGGVNRLRLMPGTNICATWSENARVFLHDLTNLVDQLDVPGTVPAVNTGPLFTFSGHMDEGFAMDWSPTVKGSLLTGDCSKMIYRWQMHGQSSWQVEKKPYTGHSGSVEDIQWSPTEDTVFASCSSDKTIKVWDTRRRQNAALSVKAHKTDVNVISWNRVSSHMLASGSDDGTFSVWDLRNFKADSPAATFSWHKGPITSVEWHPTDDSVLAVAGADDQITLWDFAVEADTEANTEDGKTLVVPEVPPQLLFIHQGQHNIKELHWHPQMLGTLVSTAESGFNIFRTISV